MNDTLVYKAAAIVAAIAASLALVLRYTTCDPIVAQVVAGIMAWATILVCICADNDAVDEYERQCLVLARAEADQRGQHR